jgi:hypothetical protein
MIDTIHKTNTMEREREIKRSSNTSSINKELVNKQKLIRQLMRSLQVVCIEVDPPRENYLEELLQSYCRELSSYYGQDDPIIKELGERIDKIEKQENTQINRELAVFLCQKLLKREKK